MTKTILEIFNNREIAIGIWVALLIPIALFKKDFRISLREFVKIFFDRLLFTIYLLQLLYLLVVILFLKYINYWDMSLLKDTIYWYFGVAFISFINVSKIKQDEDYVKKILFDNLKLLVIVEFVNNVYSFNMIVELVIIPIITLLVIISAIGESNDNYRSAKKITDSILVFITIIMTIFTLYNIITEFDSFANKSNLQSFLLSPFLTVLYMPCIFCFALYYSYLSLFCRLKKHFIKDRKNLNFTKMKILVAFHIKLRKLNRFAKKYHRINVNNRNDIVTTIKIFNRYYRKHLTTV